MVQDAAAFGPLRVEGLSGEEHLLDQVDGNPVEEMKNAAGVVGNADLDRRDGKRAIDSCIINVLYFDPEGTDETIRKRRVPRTAAPARHLVS
jgi:hypothetical protein